MHGGASPGAPKGPANGRYQFGRFTCEAIQNRREVNEMVRQMRRLVKVVA